jgi:hypothetical protein
MMAAASMSAKKILFTALFFGAAGCFYSNPWKCDEMATGSSLFSSSRLRYIPADNNSPLHFEMLRIGNQTEAFLSLSQFKLVSDSDLYPSVMAHFKLEDEEFKEALPLLEGGMKLKIPPDTLERLTLALQEGKKVSILVGGFEEILDPDQFAKNFDRFRGQGSFIEHILRGPLR